MIPSPDDLYNNRNERNISHGSSVQTVGIDNDDDSPPVLEQLSTPQETCQSNQGQSFLRRLFSNGSNTEAERYRKLSPSVTRPCLERQLTDELDIVLLRPSDIRPSFRQSLTMMISEDMYWCQICFEKHPQSRSFTLSKCGHQFCVECARNYLESKIADGQVYPVCFYEGNDPYYNGSRSVSRTCGASITEHDIESLVSTDTWARYENYKFHKENEFGRQCPFCQHLMICRGPMHPECVCANCRKSFCFTHGNAHTGKSCADFERKHARAEKQSRVVIAAITKPCLGCNNRVEKSVVDDSTYPAHFAWWNVTGCAGKQMTDDRRQSRWYTLVDCIYWLTIALVLGLPALFISLVFTVFTFFWLPCILKYRVSFGECFVTCFGTTMYFISVVPECLYGLLWLTWNMFTCLIHIFTICD